MSLYFKFRHLLASNQSTLKFPSLLLVGLSLLALAGGIPVYSTIAHGYGWISSHKSGQAPDLVHPEGRVGIHTLDPQYPLDVRGQINSYHISLQDNLTPAGTPMLNIGDDAYFTDIDEANTIAIHGTGPDKQARLRFGTSRASLKSYPDGSLCIGNCI